MRRTRTISTRVRRLSISFSVFAGKPEKLTVDYSGVDFVQEKVLNQGPQDNESAIEQAKDEQISDFIRAQYKSTAGKDFPVPDKN